MLLASLILRNTIYSGFYMPHVAPWVPQVQRLPACNSLKAPSAKKQSALVRPLKTGNKQSGKDLQGSGEPFVGSGGNRTKGPQ